MYTFLLALLLLDMCNKSIVASWLGGHVYTTVALAPVVVDAMVTASVAVVYVFANIYFLPRPCVPDTDAPQLA
mgnify:CR=1 FL=1